VAPDDARHTGQTDSGSVELGAVEALEGRKQLGGVTHVKADAIVLYKKYRVVVVASPTEVNPRSFRGGRVLPGIADQVFDDQPEQAWIDLRLLERDDAALPENDQDNREDQYHAGDLHEGANPAKTITCTLFEFVHKFNRSTNDPLSIDQSTWISHVQTLCRGLQKPD